MTTYVRARRFYRQVGINFDNDIRSYLRSGYVFSGPDHLIFGRRIGDGWYIRLAVGDGCFERWKRLMPYYLPYIGWARQLRGRSTVRWHRTEKLFRITTYARHINVLPGSSVECGE